MIERWLYQILIGMAIPLTASFFKMCIRDRYDGRTRTLEEVGKEFNVTRERIRQIEAKALRKLKHPTRSKRLRDFVDKN